MNTRKIITTWGNRAYQLFLQVRNLHNLARFMRNQRPATLLQLTPNSTLMPRHLSASGPFKFSTSLRFSSRWQNQLPLLTPVNTARCVIWVKGHCNWSVKFPILMNSISHCFVQTDVIIWRQVYKIVDSSCDMSVDADGWSVFFWHSLRPLEMCLTGMYSYCLSSTVVHT